MTITSAEAGQLLDLKPSAVRMLVQRGKLTPVRRGARPLRFRHADVVQLQRARLTADQQREIADTWAEVDAVLASQVSGV